MNAAGELLAVLAGERVFGVLNEQSSDLADGVGWMTESGSGSVHEVHGTRCTVKPREGNLRRPVTGPQPRSAVHTASTVPKAISACGGLCALCLPVVVRYDSSMKGGIFNVERHPN